MLHTIKPLDRLTAAELRQLATAAAERGEALDTANVFAVGTEQHALFTTEYLACALAEEAGAVSSPSHCRLSPITAAA